MEDKKYGKYTIGWIGEQIKKAKEDGFNNIRDWNNWKRDQTWFKGLENKYGKEFAEWARQNKDNVPKYYLDIGCKNRTEYGNICAQRLGYKDEGDRQLEALYNKGIIGPALGNEDCSYYLGICIGEKLFKKFLLTIFECVKEFRCTNKDFDFICQNPRPEFIDKYPQFNLVRKKEYTIQLKLRCLRYRTGKFWCGWEFTHIDYNNIPHCFILSAWDNRGSLQPMYIWMFHKDDMIRKGSRKRREKFWKRSSITITNTPEKLKEFEKSELREELESLKDIYKELEENL